jgi:ADP-ribose pyrophosphatase
MTNPKTPLSSPSLSTLAFEILEKEIRFKGYFSLERYLVRHDRFGGGQTSTFHREVFERGHAAAVLPYDPQRDAVVMVQQFRIGPALVGWPAWTLEPVAGIIDPGETIEDVIHRETLEEAGCRLGRVEPICAYQPSPGASTETVQVFVGEVDSTAAGGIYGRPDENEDTLVQVIPFEEALRLLDQGVFQNSLSLICLLWLARHRERLRRLWLPNQGDKQGDRDQENRSQGKSGGIGGGIA